MKKIDHPNCVKLFEVVDDPCTPPPPPLPPSFPARPPSPSPHMQRCIVSAGQSSLLLRTAVGGVPTGLATRYVLRSTQWGMPFERPVAGDVLRCSSVSAAAEKA
jgi:hypothetical protein